jgi:prepilin-type N-terminal cleavage/methylation domain-containing protein
VTRVRSGAAARRGFTLVELLVALVIIGMIAAVAVPALSARGGAAATAKQLVSLYGVAREVAISRGASAEAVLDLSSGALVIATVGRPGRPADTVRRAALALSPSVRLASSAARLGPARVTFDPLGRARGDDVVIADGKGRHRVVTDPWTGAARVEDW